LKSASSFEGLVQGIALFRAITIPGLAADPMYLRKSALQDVPSPDFACSRARQKLVPWRVALDP
jgi:hypothetical protein